MKKSQNAARNRLVRRILATAIHEAGHALADHRLGFRIKQVSIVPKDDYLGQAKSVLRLSFARLEQASLDSKAVARWHDRVVCLLAGGEAERQLGRRRLSPGGVRGDLEGVNQILERLHPENERRLVFRYLRVRAQNLVTHGINRRMILDLADVLVREHSLNGSQVLSAFQESVQREMRRRREARGEPAF